MPVQSGFGKKALDYILCINGRFASIETKREGETYTPLQASTKEDIELAGGVVLLVDGDESMAVAIAILKRLEYAPNVGHSRTDFHPPLQEEV